MAITAAMVKDLRERTGAGMMECKAALTETNGDIEAAIESLRKKGAAKAEKRAAKAAAEGVIACENDGRAGILVEVNCETDFVAKDENFRGFAQAVARTVADQRPADVDALTALTLSGSDQTVEQARQGLITKIGENIGVRRFAVIEAGDGETISHYLHDTRIGVLVRLRGDESLGRDIAMHVSWSRPLCIRKEDVPQATVEKEREIYMAQAQDSGKPAEIVARIVDGRVQKYLNEVSLLGQPFVKDPDQTVGKLIKAADAEIVDFARFEVGEGLEKRSDDFVAEVMAQAKGS